MSVPSRHTLTTVAVAACALSLYAGVTPDEAAGQTVLRACYVPNTGVVYRVGAEDTPDECRSDRHVEFSWTDGAAADHGTLSGLEDDDHPQYLQAGEVPSAWAGVEYVSSQPSFGVGANASISIGTSATCPQGKIVINGGYSIASPNDLEVTLKANGPSSERQWSVTFLVRNPRDEAVFPIPLQVSALCVNGPSGV